MSNSKKDLVVLVPGNDDKAAVEGLLQRHASFGIRQVAYTLYIHSDRDPGCRLRAHDFLRPFVNHFRHALVLFDREGCGREDLSREQLEQEVTTRLRQNGWQERAAVVVLDPELEVWVWSDSPEVARALRWQGFKQLREWLQNQNLWQAATPKPAKPKAAMEAALRHVRRPRSSAIFRRLAENVSVTRCADPAFGALREHLQKWYGQEHFGETWVT